MNQPNRANTPLTLAVVLLASCGRLSVNGSASAAPPPPTSTSVPSSDSASLGTKKTAPSGSAHDRFAVLDVKIGMPVDGRADFTCAKPTGTDVDERHCVKFLDSRCTNQPGNIGKLRYGEKAPLGCFFDYSGMATYLDGTLLQTSNTGDSTDKRPIRKPLMNLYITGTKSKPSKIYSIWYMLAFDELTEDSKLYAALVSKYGEPSYKNPPNEMRWSADDTKVKADCDRAHCRIIVEDNKLEEIERRKQEEADGQARRNNATTPNL